jgi:hypothetical protein
MWQKWFLFCSTCVPVLFSALFCVLLLLFFFFLSFFNNFVVPASSVLKTTCTCVAMWLLRRYTDMTQNACTLFHVNVSDMNIQSTWSSCITWFKSTVSHHKRHWICQNCHVSLWLNCIHSPRRYSLASVTSTVWNDQKDWNVWGITNRKTGVNECDECDSLTRVLRDFLWQCKERFFLSAVWFKTEQNKNVHHSETSRWQNDNIKNKKCTNGSKICSEGQKKNEFFNGFQIPTVIMKIGIWLSNFPLTISTTLSPCFIADRGGINCQTNKTMPPLSHCG